MWTPQAPELAQLEKIFGATLSRDAAERSQAQDLLAQARTQPQFENYLCELLITDNGAATEVRAAAGLQLKNTISKETLLPREHVQSAIFRGLSSNDALVRNITGTVITQLFSAQGVENWPQALASLLAATENTSLQEQEAAVLALSKICEDSSASLDREVGGVRPLDHMVPRLIALGQSAGTCRLRALVVTCINHLVPLKLQLVLVHLDEYLQLLFSFASDDNDEVRKSVCTAFLLLRELHPDKLVPQLAGVISYCVHSVDISRDAEETVALEACEFLLAMAEVPEKAEKAVLHSALVQILPVLLLHLVYSDELIVLMEILDSKDDTANEDRDEDVRPNMVKGKDAHRAKDESDSDLDEDELDLWNLRRCCAATVDALSLLFPKEVIDISLPTLQETIVSEDWATREAAILAFGAISKSCMELARDKLPTLVPFLVDRMKDPQPRVRQITCWTLSRYSEWVAEEAHEGGQYSLYFQPTFEALVSLTVDRQKIVQDAACSALSSFVENTEPLLLEYYVGPLLQQFARCFAMYQRKNLHMLYDCVSTFVERMGPEIFERAEYAQVLLPPLLENWQKLADDDNDLWPLLECLASVAAAIGEAFAPYAVPVYQRAVKILGYAVEMNTLVHTDPLIEAPEKNFIVTTLDLISGLMQGFKGHSRELLSHDQDFMPLVLVCLEDHDEDVRQLAYGLLGDLSIYTFAECVQPHLSQIVQFVGNEVHNCSYTSYPAANNAVWCLGEIAIRVDSALFAPFLDNVVSLLVPVMNSDAEAMLLQNTAICLGRLGCAGGNTALASRLPEFIFSWCSQMMYVGEDDEKDTAFLGMARTIETSPDDGMGRLSTAQGRKNLSLFLSCIGAYQAPSETLKEVFFSLVSNYKALLGPSWNDVLGMVDERGALQNNYAA